MVGDVEAQEWGGALSSLGNTAVTLPAQFSMPFLSYTNWHLLHSFIRSLSQNVLEISEASGISSGRWQLWETSLFRIWSWHFCHCHINCAVSATLVTVKSIWLFFFKLGSHVAQASLNCTSYPKMTLKSWSSSLHLPECWDYRYASPQLPLCWGWSPGLWALSQLRHILSKRVLTFITYLFKQKQLWSGAGTKGWRHIVAWRQGSRWQRRKGWPHFLLFFLR